MRVFVPSIIEFFAWMDQQGHRYAVLRRFEGFDRDWPRLPRGAEFDMLADDDALPAIKARYGRYKKHQGEEFDIYSLTGAHDGGEFGCPYFPLNLAEEILSARRKWKGLFYVPSAIAHLKSLLYHVTYRKADSSGISIDDPAASAGTKYFAEISALKNECGLDFPDTLLAYHEFLRDQGAAIAPEVLTRYVQQDYARACRRKKKGHKHVQNFYCHLYDLAKGEMNMFVIRSVAVKTGKAQEIIGFLRENYRILQIRDIPWLQRFLTRNKMRGGKWSRGGKPEIVVLVFDPIPIPTTAEDKKVHPFVFNARQFIKREWREWFTRETGKKASLNPLHSTDNEAEAVAHLPLFFSEAEQAEIFRQLAELRK